MVLNSLMVFTMISHGIIGDVLNQIGRLYIPNAGTGAAESVDIDYITNRVFVANGDEIGINVIDIDISDDLENANLIFDQIIPINNVNDSGSIVNIADVTSVKVIIDEGLVVAALSPENFASQEGYLVFIDTDSLNIVNTIKLDECFLPDFIGLNNKGDTLIICCEGEPNSLDNDNPEFNPEGSIQLIDISDINNIKQENINFNSFDDKINAQQQFGPWKRSIYLPYKNETFSVNAEPEYASFSADDKYAFITLQESNAIAVIDFDKKVVTDIFGLGFQSYSKRFRYYKNGLDASDRDSGINIKSYPNLYGLKQPDTIDSWMSNGRYYIGIANEGDSKDFDESRVKDLILDERAFYGTNITQLQMDENLGRLQVLNTEGFTLNNNGDKIYNKLYTFSSRNFEIWEYKPRSYFYDASLTKVYSSGDDFEKITAQKLGESGFNSDGDRTTFDSRSDNKGPEPEALGYIKCTVNNNKKYRRSYPREYVLTGLERTDGIMVYKVFNNRFRFNAKFIEYNNNRNYSILFDDRPPESAGDSSPEQIRVINENIYGKPIIIVSNEFSSSIGVYRIDCGSEIDRRE